MMLMRSFWAGALMLPFKTHLCMSIQKMEWSGRFERCMSMCRSLLRYLWECSERYAPRGNSRGTLGQLEEGWNLTVRTRQRSQKKEGQAIFLVLHKRSLDYLSEETFSYAQKILFFRAVELMVCSPSELKLQQSPGFWQFTSEKNPDTKWRKRWGPGRSGSGARTHTFFQTIWRTKCLYSLPKKQLQELNWNNNTDT